MFYSCLTFFPPAPKSSIVSAPRVHIPSILMIDSLAVGIPMTSFGGLLKFHVCVCVRACLLTYMCVIFVSRLNFYIHSYSIKYLVTPC